MATTVERYATPEEIMRLQDMPEITGRLNTHAIKKPFVYFAAFDGTDEDKNNVSLSGNPYQTNIANLYDMANEKMQHNPNIQARYYPGVGTGGEYGNILNAGPFPTEPLEETAQEALSEFADAAHAYLKTLGAKLEDLSAVTAGFSRGSAAQAMFAQMLDQEGLKLRDGTVVAPPHSVPITGMVMIDPVYTYVEGDLSLPGNVQGQVLAFGALDETRADFKRADYSLDPRVHLIELPGDHVDLGGGYDLHGIAASVLASSVNYLRNSGADLGQVPPQLRFDPNPQVPIHSEVYRAARNGDRLPDGKAPEAGSPGHRATTPVPAPTGIETISAQSSKPLPQTVPPNKR